MTVKCDPSYNCLTSVCELTITIINTSLPPPYTITSSPAAINTVITTNVFTITNLPFVSTYNIFVSTTGTCTGLGQALYNNPSLPINVSVTQTNVSCFGGSDGAALASMGGVAPYTWQWSNGSTTNSVSSLQAGTHTVIITGSKSCSATRTFVIGQPGIINSQFTSTFIPCYGGTVGASFTTTGGVGPFTYSVNGSPPGANITAGLQTIITKDSKGCLMTNTVILSQAAQQIITSVATQPNCPGESNGSATVSVSGPVAGYTYSWSQGSSVSAELGNVGAGNYTVYVLDGSNCLTASVITVPQAPVMIPVASVQKENCSAVDGAFTLSVAGGHPPFTFTTQPGNSNGNTASGLSTGYYKSYITDAHNCLDSAITYVGNLSTVSLNIFTVVAAQCYSMCNGSVILNVQNAVQPVSYSLTGMPISTSSIVSNLCPGFYAVKAIDNIGCPAFDTINFPKPPAFSYSASTPPPICIGKQSVLKATASGGNGGYSYIWNPGSLTGSVVNVEPLVTTVYSLNVYDSKGCTLESYSVQVRVNPHISIDVSNSNSGICPGSTAQITPTISGGDGNYTYNWTPGNTKGASIFVENITVPVYVLTVNDGCGSPTAVKEIDIKIHPVIKPEYKEEGQGGCVPYCTTFMNLTPGSTNAIWNYGDKPFEQLGDTTYYCYKKAGNFNLRLVVTDSNGCRASFTYTNAVKVLVKPEVSFSTDPAVITLNESENVLIRNTSHDGSSFKWYLDGAYLGNTKDMNYTFRDTGCYDIRLMAVNENGCVDSTTRSICVFEGFNFYMPNAFTPNNDGRNDILLPKGTGWLFENYKFEVYNRWGVKVFSTTDVYQGWDGGVKTDPYGLEVYGADMNDVYSWRAVVTDNLKRDHALRGFVTLVR